MNFFSKINPYIRIHSRSIWRINTPKSVLKIYNTFWCGDAFFGDFTFGLNDVIDKLGCVEEMIKSDLTFNKYVAFENLFSVSSPLKWF